MYHMLALAQDLPVGPSPTPLTAIEDIVSKILKVATGLAGLAILVTLIIGAFTYLTAGADQEKAQKAKGAFTAAAIGGALLIFIWLILRFIEEFTGVKVTKFKICINPPCSTSTP